MFKRITTFLLLLLLVGNTLAALPPHQSGTGGCEAECCETAHETGPAATIAGVCCMLECPPAAELAPVLARNTVPPANGLPAPVPTNVLDSLAQPQTRFPSAPTRYLHGSSSRYLDCCSFLL